MNRAKILPGHSQLKTHFQRSPVRKLKDACMRYKQMSTAPNSSNALMMLKEHKIALWWRLP